MKTVSMTFPLVAIALILFHCAGTPVSAGADEPVRLTFVGDIMVHGAQLARAWDSNNRRFDFYPSLAEVSPLFSDSDEVIGNLETTLAGPDGALSSSPDDAFGKYQGYPLFNTPDALAPALKKAGFTILTTANNHSLDSGVRGLDRTRGVLIRNGLRSVGTGLVGRKPLYFTRKGIRFVLVNVTFATNISRPPVYDPGVINSLENYHPDRMAPFLSEILSLRRSNRADIIVVTIHYGEEYRNTPDRRQQALNAALLSAGADIVAGHHPHVMQPVEVRTIRDSTGRIRTGVIFPSLGNFISSYQHNERFPWFCDSGLIATVEIATEGNRRGTVTGVELIPVWMQWLGRLIRVIPVGEALTEGGGARWQLTRRDRERLTEVKDHAENHIGRYLGFREGPPGVYRCGVGMDW